MKRSVLASFLIILAVFFVACNSNTPPIVLENSAWATPIDIDSETYEFTPNLMLHFNNDSFEIRQFGTGLQLFHFPYQFNGRDLTLEDNTVPFMKIISQNDDQMLVSFGPEDTTLLHRIDKDDNTFNTIQERLIGHTFNLISPQKDKKLIYWGEDEIFYFSDDLQSNKERPALHFKRMNYQMSMHNGMTTLMIGDDQNPEIGRLADGSLDIVNLMIGQIHLHQEDIQLITYSVSTTSHYSLRPVERKPENDLASLVGSEWKLGGALNVNFKDDQQATLTKKGQQTNYTYRIDDSGYLIILEDEMGGKQFAIRDFGSDQSRMGIELIEGRFSELLNIK